MNRVTPGLLISVCSFAVGADFERGEDASDRKDYDTAIACFTAHLRDNPSDADVLICRGKAYFDKRHYDKAIDDFTKAIRLDPQGVVAYRVLCNYDPALGDFKQVNRLAPEDYLGQAFLYRATGEEYLAIPLGGKDCTRLAYHRRGDAHVQKRAYGMAINDYRAAIRLDPKNPFAYNALAWLLATCQKDGARDGKNAVVYATKACELWNWKDVRCLHTLAAAHAEAGDFKEAAKWERKAIELGYDEDRDREQARERLKSYEAGKPLRDD